MKNCKIRQKLQGKKTKQNKNKNILLSLRKIQLLRFGSNSLNFSPSLQCIGYILIELKFPKF